VLANLAQERDAIHARHVDVGDHEIRRLLEHTLEGNLTVFGTLYLVALGSKQELERRA
jgi:hypothetical protein